MKSNESQMLSEDKLQFSLWWDVIPLEKIKNTLTMIENGNQLPAKESKYIAKKSWIVPAFKKSN